MDPKTRSARLWLCVMAGVAGLLMAVPARAATITVDTLAFAESADTFCSLPEAVLAANTNAAVDACVAGAAGTDTIAFSVAGTIFYNSWLHEFTESAVVEGVGIVFDGAGQQRLFSVDSGLVGQKLTINDAVLQNGWEGYGGAVWVGPGETLWLQDSRIQDCDADFGAGIFAAAAERVRIVRSQLSRNEAQTGGGVHVSGGALVIEDSTFDHNVAGYVNGGGWGGAVYAIQVTFEIRRSTFTANTAKSDGGALALYLDSTGTISSSTIASNVADSDADDLGDGGGLWLAITSSATLKNTVVAANTDSSSTVVEPDFSLQPDGSSVDGTAGWNFVGSNESVAVQFPLAALLPTNPNIDGNYVGSPAARLLPRLGALAANGGPTDTRMPLPASPLIDHGGCINAPADQRGYGSPLTALRAYDDLLAANGLNTPDGCDIGAVERLAVP